MSRLDTLLAEFKVPEQAVAFIKQVTAFDSSEDFTFILMYAQLLVLNPDGRISGADAMKLNYVKSSPNCTDLAPMRIVESSLHEYETKQLLKAGPLKLKPMKEEPVVHPKAAVVSGGGSGADDQNSNAKINGRDNTTEYSASRASFPGQEQDMANAKRRTKTRIPPQGSPKRAGQTGPDGPTKLKNESTGQYGKRDRANKKPTSSDKESRYRSRSPYRRTSATKRRRRRS